MRHIALAYDSAWHGLLFTGMGVGLLGLAVVALAWAGVVGVVWLFKKKG